MGQVSVLEDRKLWCCFWAEKYFSLESIRSIAGESDLAGLCWQESLAWLCWLMHWRSDGQSKGTKRSCAGPSARQRSFF